MATIEDHVGMIHTDQHGNILLHLGFEFAAGYNLDVQPGPQAFFHSFLARSWGGTFLHIALLMGVDCYFGCAFLGIVNK